jgi:hypothetical protein
MTDSFNTSLITDEASSRNYIDDATILGRPYASFEAVAVPVPTAIWHFGSGLLGLFEIARKKK